MQHSMENEVFFKKAIKVAKLEDHPKAIEIYQDAWRLGWRGGPSEVLKVICDLARIEKEVENEHQRTT